MKELFSKRVWLIMSKDRKVVAKGTPRNRSLAMVDDKTNNQRFLTYSSKGRATGAFGGAMGFYNQHLLSGWEYGTPISDHLEAVECDMIIREI